MKTIYILWLRQLKRYFRSRSRMIGSLAQPLFFLLSLGYGFGPVFKAAGQGSYIQFLVPGIIGMSIIFTSIFSGMEIIWDRQFGFLKETLVAPVSRFNIMIGRTLGGATVATMQGVLVFLISLFIGFKPIHWGLVPLAIVIMLLSALLFTAMGTAIASRLEDMQGFQLIMNFLVMPLFFLSGAIFPLAGAGLLGKIAQFDPLSYSVDALRSLLSGISQFGIGADFCILAIITFAFLALGSYFFSKIQI
ncbi:MAG TPA: ABC transporter permease [Candidatus Paceibacterota bacterium]|nr:ABC transporter permease [Candidatus Paceibacterota bacterium]